MLAPISMMLMTNHLVRQNQMFMFNQKKKSQIKNEKPLDIYDKPCYNEDTERGDEDE